MEKISYNNNKKRKFPGLADESGSAIVIALIVLAAVTIIGVTTSNISVTESLITGNDIAKKISFFNSDAGIFAVPKVISRAINDKATPAVLSPPFTFIDVGTDTTPGNRTFYRELAGYEAPDDDADITFLTDPSINNNTQVDVQRLGSFTLVGGGAEFGSGAEGQGTSLKGIRFTMNSVGQGPKNSITNLQARYLKVIGVAGGL